LSEPAAQFTIAACLDKSSPFVDARILLRLAANSSQLAFTLDAHET